MTQYLLVFSAKVKEHTLQFSDEVVSVCVPRFVGRQQWWIGRLEFLDELGNSLTDQLCVLPGESVAAPGWPLDLLTANGGSATPITINPTRSMRVRLASPMQGLLLVYLSVTKRVNP